METKFTKILLKFRKSDFNGEYAKYKTCAISKALARAGFPKLKEVGGIISTEQLRYIRPMEVRKFDKMHDRVLNMYHHKRGIAFYTEPPKAFQATIYIKL